MRDLISKVTFGFLMAQLFPGALLAFALTFLYCSLLPSRPGSVYQGLNVVMSLWESVSIGRALALTAVCIGLGMLIHGLHWAVIGSLESRFESVFDSYWHDLPIWVQVLLGPVKIVREILDFLFRTGHVRLAGVCENVSKLPAERLGQFQYLQDFYLYSAQFLLHTSYALLGSFAGMVVYTLLEGITLRRVGLVVALYGATGLFFVLGRIQLHTLFRAEEELGRQ